LKEIPVLIQAVARKTHDDRPWGISIRAIGLPLKGKDSQENGHE
jgi:hypothetical protein